MDEKAKEDFEIKNGRLLIGGPCDGQRYVPRDVRRVEPLARIVESSAASVYSSSLDSVGPPLTYTTYFPEILRGNQIEMIFYRHESLSLDQALVLVIAKYPKNYMKQTFGERGIRWKTQGENASWHGTRAADMSRDELLMFIGAICDTLNRQGQQLAQAAKNIETMHDRLYPDAIPLERRAQSVVRFEEMGLTPEAIVWDDEEQHS